jgi:RNA polymerase sigma-70 factor (ECF subfamily)
MDSRNDLELWRLARADPDAFGVLFERHGRAVYAFCARRTADLALAEDLTSIVFLEAWRRRQRTEITGESLLPWLLGIAHNAVRNAHRSRRRHRAALARLPPEPLEAAADDVASRIDAERALAGALQAIRTLPDRERDVVVLVLWSGLSYEDAALVLGVPAGTVRSRLSRARARLSASLVNPFPSTPGALK